MRKKCVAVILCLFASIMLVSSAVAAENLNIYIGDDNAENFVKTVVQGEKDADTMIAKLIDLGMLMKGTGVNSFHIVKEQGKTVGQLDMNKVYGENLQTMGTRGELMSIYSVVNTIVDNFKLDELALTVDGKVIETGHAIYDQNLKFMVL